PPGRRVGRGRAHAPRRTRAARILPLALLRRLWLPRLPVGTRGHGVRGRCRADRMGAVAVARVAAGGGGRGRSLPDRPERPLPFRRPGGRAVRLVVGRGGSLPGVPLRRAPLERAGEGDLAPEPCVGMSRRCLAVHPGALGDVLLAGAALAHLRALGYRPTLAVTSRLVPLYEASGLVDAAVDLEGLGLHRLFMESPDRRALRELESFDAVVCWMGAGDATFRSNLAKLGPPTVVARAAPPAGAGVHVSRHLLASLAPLGPLPQDMP